MGSMGESTRRRLEGVVRAANAGGAAGDFRGGGEPAGGGGGGYTWGKAGTGRSTGPSAVRPNARPQSAAASAGNKFGWGQDAAGGVGADASYRGGGGDGTNATAVALASAQRKKELIKRASAGAQNLWGSAPAKELPRTAPHGLGTTKFRPQSAGPAMHTTTEATAVRQVEYKLQGTGLGPDSGGGGGGGGGAGSFGFERGGVSFADGSQSVMQNARRLQAGNQRDAPAPAAGPVAGRPRDAPEDVSEGAMDLLDDKIRDALRLKRSVYEEPKAMLLRLFKEVDDGSGDVSCEEFAQVCSRLGLRVGPAQCRALFAKYGYESVMPYQRFAATLLTQPNRQLAEDMPVRKGAFVAGQPCNFQGKIIYQPCRKPVYTPSDWDPQLIERSADLPDARLMLEFVYGYNGIDNTSQNLLYTGNGHIVYYTAGVAVVYAKHPLHQQHFFLGHSDDIKALALCPAAIDMGGMQFPARTLVATGQVSSHEEGPYVCVWDSRVGSQGGQPELVKLQFEKEERGITALAFSPDGTKLVAVATDNAHSLYIYDWRRSRVLGTGRGSMGEPPQVFGIEWNPHELTHQLQPHFATYGRKHVKVWRVNDESKEWASTSLSMGRFPVQNITAVAWLLPKAKAAEEGSLLAAGTSDGQIYLFKGTTPIKAISAHKPGPKFIQPDGHPSFVGLRGMRLCKGGKVLITGGADGTITQWDVADGTMQDGRTAGPTLEIKSPFADDAKPPAVRSLDYWEEGDRILVGTSDCDIMEISDKGPELLIYGHSSDIWNVAWHPTDPAKCATVCDGSRVFEWDTLRRQMTRSSLVGFTARAVAFSSGPVLGGDHHIAVGGAKGHLRILDETDLKPLADARDSKEGITELRYSPNNRYLAAATADTWVDVYNVERGYSRVSRCTGHSATVRQLDWSHDSSILQTNCAALEILYWNPKTGKQMTFSMRDTRWASWSCILGFPVMGIWQDCSDATDINALHRSNSGEYVVTSDDFGLVKLFNYPCVVDDAPHRAYRGHSSHVMCVRFNCADSRVVSVGGHDCAMFQFKFVKLEPPPVPEPEPEPVWGPTDATGRSMGMVRPTRGPSPLAPTPRDAAPAVSAAAPQPPATAATAIASHPTASGTGRQAATPQPEEGAAATSTKARDTAAAAAISRAARQTPQPPAASQPTPSPLRPTASPMGVAATAKGRYGGEVQQSQQLEQLEPEDEEDVDVDEDLSDMESV